MAKKHLRKTCSSRLRFCIVFCVSFVEVLDNSINQGLTDSNHMDSFCGELPSGFDTWGVLFKCWSMLRSAHSSSRINRSSLLNCRALLLLISVKLAKSYKSFSEFLKGNAYCDLLISNDTAFTLGFSKQINVIEFQYGVIENKTRFHKIKVIKTWLNKC